MHQGDGFVADFLCVRIGAEEVLLGGGDVLFILRLQRQHHLAGTKLLLFMSLFILHFQEVVFAGMIAGLHLGNLGGIEKDRRCFELVKGEEHRADEQDEKLHRDLHNPIQQQAEAALGDRLAGEVALHLRLVGAEVGELQEHPSQDAGPDVVAVVPVEAEIDRVEPSQLPGQVGGFQQGDAVRQVDHDHEKCRKHPEHDDHHLVEMGPVNRFGSPRGGVDDHQGADDQVGPVDVPAQDDREDERRSVDGQSRRQSPPGQEQQAGQGAGLQVEAVFQVFVGGMHLQAVVDRDGSDREDHHPDRQAEVELHEAHSIHIGLAGGGEEGDGAGLGGHDRQQHGIPAHAAVGQKVAGDVLAAAALPDPVDHNKDQRGG